VSKLCDADAEAAETQTWLDIALDCGYLSREDHERLLDRYRHICAQLTLMMDDPDRWCAAFQRPQRSQ
jgi:four helix bundle protein